MSNKPGGAQLHATVRKVWSIKKTKNVNANTTADVQAKVMARLKHMQRACTEEDWLKALEKMEAACSHPFQAYFSTNWLHNNWRKGWHDLN